MRKWHGDGQETAEPERTDILRQLARLAFGGAGDAVRLAMDREEWETAELDLAAVSEFKVTDKSVEVKLVDRVRALETLWGLLESRDRGGPEDNALCRALMELKTGRETENGG